MKLDFETYREKVMGCWTGKNIGGVLGAPFEGKRQWNDVSFYTQDLSMGPPPNDDLDLQIVWLAAAERYGRNVNASILGEYWLSYVIPNWVEYGTGKANLRAGLQPPISGLLDNTYKDSCGCYIRSEIWACLAPGNPELAARYAFEDGIVDHAGEGVYGEIFFAALQSAAFVEGDKRKLIDIGLSYIPGESKTAAAIRKAVECYENHVDPRQARVLIHNTAPGTFGVQSGTISEIPVEGNEGMELGAPGFDAPENVAFTVAGLLYGEEDFGKSLCTAVAFGEDTDCTCATLGAVLGILLGEKGIPEKWKEPLNDQIATMCIDRTSGGIWVPATVTELTDRVMRAAAGFLGQEICDIFAEGGMTIECRSGDELFCRRSTDYIPKTNGNGKDESLPVSELSALSPYVVRYDFPAFRLMVDYEDSVFFRAGENRKIRVIVVNSHTMRQQQWARISVYVPMGVENINGRCFMLPLNNLYGSRAEAEIEFKVDWFDASRLEFVVDVSLEGRHSSGAVKVTLMRQP